MSESNTSFEMPEMDIMALKEALFAQQQLLQKLYHELDKEREASATAVSEALAMILRLQGEKAAVEMEANQYKRMAEQKLCYAEESLAIFEDIVYQKEMEISSLECQVQAHNKLGAREVKFWENLLLQKKEHFVVDVGPQGNVSRTGSLPLDRYIKKGMIDRGRSQIPISDFVPRIFEEKDCDSDDKHVNSAFGDFNSYWERIKRLDEKVKEISNFKGLTGRSASCSMYSQVSRKGDASCSSSVQDIFEIPQDNDISKHYGRKQTEQSNLISEKDEIDWVEKAQLFTNRGKRPPRVDDGVTGEHHLALVRRMSGVVEYQDEIQQVGKRMERSDDLRNTVKQVYNDGREEELKLLKDIGEHLNLIHLEIRSWKIHKSSPFDEATLVSLSEAMLHFWL